MNNLRVVLDTNVIISGIIAPKGLPAQILAALKARRFTLVTSLAIAQEVMDVIQRPKIQKYVHEDRHQEILALLLGKDAHVVEGKIAVINLADQDDEVFLSAAIEAQAHYLVSGDQKHLLILGEYKGIPIVSPAKFLEVLNS